MKDCPQFISAPTCPASPPPPPSSPPPSFFPEGPPPEETEGYARDVRDDLLSGDLERQEDGLRRLLILALESGTVDFHDTGRIVRTGTTHGVLGALVELSLCREFREVWPPEGEQGNGVELGLVAVN